MATKTAQKLFLVKNKADTIQVGNKLWESLLVFISCYNEQKWTYHFPLLEITKNDSVLGGENKCFC